MRSRRLGTWSAFGFVVTLIEFRFGAERVPLPRLGQPSVEIAPATLLATVLPIAVAYASTLNSDVYVGGATEVERVFARNERGGFVLFTALWWLTPELFLLTHAPHQGVSAYAAALSVLLPLTWVSSVFLGSPLSWLTATLYDLAALSAGSTATGQVYWWDWWRATSLSARAWWVTACWAVLSSGIYVLRGARRRVSDVDV